MAAFNDPRGPISAQLAEGVVLSDRLTSCCCPLAVRQPPAAGLTLSGHLADVSGGSTGRCAQGWALVVPPAAALLCLPAFLPLRRRPPPYFPAHLPLAAAAAEMRQT